MLMIGCSHAANNMHYSKRLSLLYLIEHKKYTRLHVLNYYLTCLVNYRTSRLHAISYDGAAKTTTAT